MSNQLTPAQKAWTQTFQLSEKLTMRPIDVKRLLNLEHVEVNEAVLFLKKCQQYGADPFMNDMYMIKYSANATAAIVTGVGFFQKKAAANPRFRGYGKTLWLSKDGKWVDCWIPSLHGQNPMACQASCYIDGYEEKQTFAVNWEENHKNTSIWKSMPSRMLEKNAVVGLLRACLPADLGGLYINEEITGEEAPQATVAPATVKLESINEDLRDPEGGEVFEADIEPVQVDMSEPAPICEDPAKLDAHMAKEAAKREPKVSKERQEIDAQIAKKAAEKIANSLNSQTVTVDQANNALAAPERSDEATNEMPSFGEFNDSAPEPEYGF